METRPPVRSWRRRDFLASLAAFTPSLTRASTTLYPLLGAIRWDAWYVPGSVPTTAVEYALSPDRWRWRRPFFAEETADGVRVRPPSAEVMALEMAQAVAAGLDFWAFVGYPADNAMSVGLNLYLAATMPGPRFCFFQEVGYWGTFARPSGLMERQAELLGHPRHQRLPDGRPPFFLGWIERGAVDRNWGGPEGLRWQINKFRTLVRATTGAEPFIIVGGGMPRPEEWAVALGADALGNYAVSGGAEEAPYAALAARAEHEWSRQVATGWPVVPLAMSGWDRRPRVERPVPWERGQVPGAGIRRFYAAPTRDELETHLRGAMRAATSGLALIYAWNELDEGGWLVPTAGCDATRLDAVRSALARPALPPDLCGRFR